MPDFDKMKGGEVLDVMAASLSRIAERLGDFEADCQKVGSKCSDPNWYQDWAAVRASEALLRSMVLESAKKTQPAPGTLYRIFADVARKKMVEHTKRPS